MSTLFRRPNTVTVHCHCTGCRWLKTYFIKDRGRFSHRPELRAAAGLRSHCRTHKVRITLINGR